MTGLDTSFLIAYENSAHKLHGAARSFAVQHQVEGFALAPQVLTEFLHVISDSRRFSNALAMNTALTRASRWWTLRDVHQVFPDAGTFSVFAAWMRDGSLGRKRILDTMLAATYLGAGVNLIATTNWRDFGAFSRDTPGCSCVTPVTR